MNAGGLNAAVIDILQIGNESSLGSNNSLSKHRYLLIFRELCSALACGFACL